MSKITSIYATLSKCYTILVNVKVPFFTMFMIVIKPQAILSNSTWNSDIHNFQKLETSEVYGLPLHSGCYWSPHDTHDLKNYFIFNGNIVLLWFIFQWSNHYKLLQKSLRCHGMCKICGDLKTRNGVQQGGCFVQYYWNCEWIIMTVTAPEK